MWRHINTKCENWRYTCIYENITLNVKCFIHLESLLFSYLEFLFSTYSVNLHIWGWYFFTYSYLVTNRGIFTFEGDTIDPFVMYVRYILNKSEQKDRETVAEGHIDALNMHFTYAIWLLFHDTGTIERGQCRRVAVVVKSLNINRHKITIFNHDV